MILDKIVAATQKRVTAAKEKTSLEQLRQTAIATPAKPPFSFEKALHHTPFAFICEVKKASPSKGLIAAEFPYKDIALEYEAAGAAAISVLTEPDFFLGSDEYLREIAATVNIPVLRKDFIIDAYQIYEAKCLGADAILCICSILTSPQLKESIQIADTLGLSVLVETHNADEVAMALSAGARVIGVNNRNLSDFSVDMQTSLRLRPLVPDNIAFVAESGIQSNHDIEILKEAHIGAALIGETLMRCRDKATALAALNGWPTAAKIKICGLSRSADIDAVNAAKPDYIGFVFADGQRKVTLDQARELKKLLDPAIQAVGVFVDSAPEEIIHACREGIIDIIQLHGNESNDTIRYLKSVTGKIVIKAIRVASEQDIAAAQQTLADYLLFDSFSQTTSGGTGNKFDWHWLRSNTRPFFLAGGINSQNAMAAIYQASPYAIDISSGVESAKCKDPLKIQKIIKLVRSVTK